MDALFPWRKQQQPQPPPPSTYSHGSSSSSGHHVGNNNHHSLPHPEEHHAQHYNGRRQLPPRWASAAEATTRIAHGTSESSRLFGFNDDTINNADDEHYDDDDGGGYNNSSRRPVYRSPPPTEDDSSGGGEGLYETDPPPPPPQSRDAVFGGNQTPRQYYYDESQNTRYYDESQLFGGTNAATTTTTMNNINYEDSQRSSTMNYEESQRSSTMNYDESQRSSTMNYNQPPIPQQSQPPRLPPQKTRHALLSQSIHSLASSNTSASQLGVMPYHAAATPVSSSSLPARENGSNNILLPTTTANDVSPLRQLLDAINMSILPSSLRLSSLAMAVEFFDHRDRSMHDVELIEGAAYVLYHKLGLALRLSRCGKVAVAALPSSRTFGAVGITSGDGPGGGGVRRSSFQSAGGNSGLFMGNHYLSYQHSLANSLALQQQTEYDKEIAMVCSCLEMVHRANPDAIAQTWDECGVEILPFLVSVLERPFLKIERAISVVLLGSSSNSAAAANVPGSMERAVAMAVTRDMKLAVQKVTKVLAMYSLVPDAKRPMCDSEGMLRWLTRIIDTHNYNRVKPGAPPVMGGTASTRLGAGSGGVGETTITTNAMDEESDERLRRARRLELAALATSGNGLYMTEAARFNTIAILTNLAAHESNRMLMLHEPGLLDNICRVVHNERNEVPKQCSALAIMNLSNGDMDHVPEMARNDLVLETLLKLMKEDNPETRRNAVVTIFNVACSDQNTVRLARYRDGIVLDALVDLVGSDDPVLRGHDEARANAAETLFNMACSEISETTDRMANHAGLLECLAVTLRGEHTGLEVKMYCSATLRRMAEIIRHPMIAQGALLSALVKGSTWTNTDCIAEAFHAQALVPENCVIMAHHHGLLNALSRLALAKGDGDDTEKVRIAACLAIELMSRRDEVRTLLSQNEGIMMALTKASYGEVQQKEFVDRRMSGMTTDFNIDSSHKSSEGGGDDDDDVSMQSRRIQLALKNLVEAM